MDRLSQAAGAAPYAGPAGGFDEPSPRSCSSGIGSFPPSPSGAQPGTVGDLRNVFGVPPPTQPQGRLVVRCHDFSESQTEYQAARSHEPGVNVFYKDATPRGEHYIRCTVTCEPPQHWAVPLRLTMCYEDMSEVSPQDSSCLKILGDGSRKLVAPREGAPSTFYYRIELGSFRRADRKFRVQISAAGGGELPGGPGAPPPVAPCATPPLLILSKKKVEPGREAAPGSSKPRRALPDGLRPGQRPAAEQKQSGVASTPRLRRG